MNYYERLKDIREDNDLTQVDVAEILKTTRQQVSKWETGKGLPDASIMKDLCNILKITVNELLSGELINKEEYNLSEQLRSSTVIFERRWMEKSITMSLDVGENIKIFARYDICFC